jgi:carboxyl-terminal processing protease
LRDNPGGLLTAGVDVARLFLKDGVVIEQQYKGRDVETFHVEKPGPLADLPLTVLINGGSASAAEIIAGAIKAHRRAMLVGETSYGKSTIQLVFDLKDGSSLHVTAARWWIPGLEAISGLENFSRPENVYQGKGIEPDIRIGPASDPANRDPAVAAAIAVLVQ